jgi:signal transduction histidine kinase
VPAAIAHMPYSAHVVSSPSSLRWRVLLALALAAVVPTVIVGALAILHQQPEHEAYALARRTTRDIAIAGIAAIAVALALGAVFATRLTRRIAERTELQARLARSDRLATVGVMAAQVAHEINHPLTAVLGYAKLLQEDKPAGHPDRAALERIAGEAERMKAIVGGLLEHARASGRDLPPPTCEVAAVVKHVGAMLGPKLEQARAKLELDLAATSPVAIEAHALQQVLVDLVQHALHAMAGAGAEGPSEGPSEGPIAIAARPGPGGVATVIAISGEGPGLPAAGAGTGPGPGLDLAVARHLIATAGGTLEVGERPGRRGTELRVTLPNAARAA